jgi:hypothetical protein
MLDAFTPVLIFRISREVIAQFAGLPTPVIGPLLWGTF